MFVLDMIYHSYLFIEKISVESLTPNPCPATPGYIRFQADFKPNNMSLKTDNMVCGRCSVSQGAQFKRCVFSKNMNIFCHSKLEIALQIPASNNKKYNTTNSAGQGLIAKLFNSYNAGLILYKS